MSSKAREKRDKGRSLLIRGKRVIRDAENGATGQEEKKIKGEVMAMMRAEMLVGCRR